MAQDRGIEMIAGDLALDFANTVGWHAREKPVEHLETYADFIQWARRAGVVTTPQATEMSRQADGAPAVGERALEQARRLRETIYRVFSGLALGKKPAAGDLAELMRRVARATAAGTPEWRRGSVNLVWDHADLDWPLHPIALAAGALLSSPQRDRLRQCGNDPCGWLFMDATRNRSRRWCTSAECGNQTRVRRFRTRTRRRG